LETHQKRNGQNTRSKQEHKRLRKANLVLMEVEQLDEENLEARKAMN